MTTDAAGVGAKMMPLSQGTALGVASLRDVTARDDTTIVLLAGPVASGKTTILISLYELFNQGPVGGLLFAGSSTLAGFEQICHLGRQVSGNQSPETGRTSRTSGPTFLHLRVGDVRPSAPSVASLLISDVTGEAFDEARGTSEPTIIPRSVWRRANVLCVLLDGEELSFATKRQAARTNARTLLRAAHESKLLAPQCRIVSVVTKLDLLRSREAIEFVDGTEVLLEQQFGPLFASFATHRIAARPSSTDYPYAYGVAGLLTEILKRPQSRAPLFVPPESTTGLGSFTTTFWQRERATVAKVFNDI